MFPFGDDGSATNQRYVAARVVIKGTAFRAIIVWLSYKRALVRMTEPPEVGTKLSMFADLLPNANAEIAGVVRRVKPLRYSAGPGAEIEVHFTWLSPQALALLQTFLDDTIERRHHVKNTFQVLINLSKLDVNQGVGNIKLNRSGMFVTTEVPVPKGARILAHLQMGKDIYDTLVVEGVVVSAMPLTKAVHTGGKPGINIRFQRFPEGGEREYVAMVRRLERMESENVLMIDDDMIEGEAFDDLEFVDDMEELD